jgi:hypothetical protein
MRLTVPRNARTCSPPKFLMIEEKKHDWGEQCWEDSISTSRIKCGNYTDRRIDILEYGEARLKTRSTRFREGPTFVVLCVRRFAISRINQSTGRWMPLMGMITSTRSEYRHVHDCRDQVVEVCFYSELISQQNMWYNLLPVEWSTWSKAGYGGLRPNASTR